MLPIPLIIKAAFSIFKCTSFIIIAKIAFAIQVIFAVIISGLLAIEFHKDKRLDLYYKIRKIEVKTPKFCVTEKKQIKAKLLAEGEKLLRSMG